MTTLEPNELITEVRVPDPGARACGTYLKLERKIGDFATVGVAVQVSLSNGTVGQGRDRPHGRRSHQHARPGGRGGARRARSRRGRDQGRGKLAAEAAQPRDDVRGTADFKRSVVRVYTERGLRQAVAEAQAGQEGG